MDDVVDPEIVARWAEFPVDADPRPIVLVDNPVRVDGVFVDADFESAWLDGAIELGPSVPTGVAEMLPVQENGSADSVLSVTKVTPTTARFRCDRGFRDLPACRLKISGLRGACVTLSPDVECWWPSNGSERQRGTGGTASVDADGITVHLPAPGGVELHEYERFVVARLVGTGQRAMPDTALGMPSATPRATGRLRDPLDGRVLLNAGGQPLAVLS